MAVFTLKKAVSSNPDVTLRSNAGCLVLESFSENGQITLLTLPLSVFENLAAITADASETVLTDVRMIYEVDGSLSVEVD